MRRARTRQRAEIVTAAGLPRFRDATSREATMRSQSNRIDSIRSLFGTLTLVGSRSESGSDRGADWPSVEAQAPKPSSVDNSCLNPRQPGYSHCDFTPTEYEITAFRPPYFRSKKYRLNFPHITMAAPIGGVSPSRSPRLPSPPPFPEVQIGPKSPGFNPEQSTAIPENNDTTKLDNGAMRRIRPGTKAADMAFGPPLVPLAEVRSPNPVCQISSSPLLPSWTPLSNFKSISKPSTTTTPNLPPPIPLSL